MPLKNDQKADMPNPTGRHSDAPVAGDAETQANSSIPVIELADLSTDAEAEVNRLKSSMTTLLGEISQIRGKQDSLTSDYQKLIGELRNVKLVLAKVHAKELRAVEGGASWTQSLRDLGERFKIIRNRPKNEQAKNRVSSVVE